MSTFGFLILCYIAVIQLSVPSVFCQDNSHGCHVKRSDEKGEVAYENPTSEENQVTCSYSITTNESALVAVTFSEVELTKNYDLVYVFDGPECHARGWLPVTTVSKGPKVSSSNQLTVFVRFTTDENNRMKFAYEPGTQSTKTEYEKKCGEEISAEFGGIDTVEKPTTQRAPCTYKITSKSENKINLQIKYFNTTPVFNELWIYDGPDCGSPMILYVNRETQWHHLNVISSGSVMSILSLSDETTSPFTVVFDKVREPIITTPSPEPITTSPPYTIKPGPEPFITSPPQTTTPSNAIALEVTAVNLVICLLSLVLQPWQ